MKAIASYVWLLPIRNDLPQTKSGVITDTKAEVPTTGTVVAIGKLCDMTMLDGLKIGDVVGFDPLHIRTITNPITGEENFIFLDRNIPYILCQNE